MYKVLVDRSAEKDLEYLDKNVIRRILQALEKLARDPRPIGVKRLNAVEEDLYRIRVGDYRVIYAILEKVKIVSIRRVRHRKDVYKNL